MADSERGARSRPLDGARQKEADRKFEEMVDRALEQGYVIGRVFEQARVMFFLVKIEGRPTLAARLAKHLDSQPSPEESGAAHGAVMDVFGDQPPKA